MLVIDVADMAAGRERRNGDHQSARARPEEIDRLDESRVVKATPLVSSDKDRGLGPLLLVALGELDNVVDERFEEEEAGCPSIAPSGFT